MNKEVLFEEEGEKRELGESGEGGRGGTKRIIKWGTGGEEGEHYDLNQHYSLNSFGEYQK